MLFIRVLWIYIQITICCWDPPWIKIILTFWKLHWSSTLWIMQTEGFIQIKAKISLCDLLSKIRSDYFWTTGIAHYCDGLNWLILSFTSISFRLWHLPKKLQLNCTLLRTHMHEQLTAGQLETREQILLYKITRQITSVSWWSHCAVCVRYLQPSVSGSVKIYCSCFHDLPITFPAMLTFFGEQFCFCFIRSVCCSELLWWHAFNQLQSSSASWWRTIIA